MRETFLGRWWFRGGVTVIHALHHMYFADYLYSMPDDMKSILLPLFYSILHWTTGYQPFLDASSTASFSAPGARTTLTLVTVGGCGAVGAARLRGRARNARIKERVEREGSCIFRLGC